METELLKEPWIFTQPKVNSAKLDDNAIAPVWEENFQDLSDWCMDTFQGQCDFHIGESTNAKLSGTKYEGNSVLSSEEGVFKELSRVTDEEKWSMKMYTAGMSNHSNDSNRSTEPALAANTRFANGDTTTDTTPSISWAKQAKDTVTNTNGTSWNRQNNTDLNTAFQSKYRVEELDLDEPPPSIDSSDNQRETWDVLRTVETTGSDTFDLLSYLCDDEMRSPEGSMSTDSSTISRPRERIVRNSRNEKTVAVQVKVEEDESLRPRMETRGTCTATSSNVDNPGKNLRKIDKMRTIASNKVEKSYTRGRREKQGRKRYAESDSDDHSSVSHYRESRQKNNEASRKSRMNKKAKENEMAVRAIELERDNRILKMKVDELEKLVTSMRSALLKSALKKEL